MLTSRIILTKTSRIRFPISTKWGIFNFSKLQSDINDDLVDSRHLRKTKSNSQKNGKKVTKSITKSNTIKSENNSSFNIGQHKGHLKGTRSISYIVDEGAAKLICKFIKKDLKPHDVILESHPGPGILTKLLLKETSNNIFAYEPKTYFRNELVKELHESECSRLTISELDLHRFYSYYIQTKKAPDIDKLSSIIDALPVNTDNCDSRVKIATIVTDKKFFYRLNLSYAFQCCFFNTESPINPVIYAFIPCRWLDILSGYKRNSTSNLLSVPFHFYFEYEYLDKFPIEGFYPVHRKSSEKTRREDDDYFHLIRIKCNPHMKDKVPAAELDNFYYFLNRMLRTKVQDTFIGQIEKFLPNSGPEFIKEGFRVFAHPRDFSQEQFLLAYRIFCSHPAYEYCMFHYYKRHWAMMFGEKDDDVLRLKCDEESAIDLEEEDADIDVAHDFHSNPR